MEKLREYNRMLIEKNAVMNLTAHKTENESWHKNITDSLLFAAEFEALGAAAVLDIGSGAGLPGIPLAVMCPKLEITMADSVGKKIAFINEVVDKLGITNARGIHTRIEDFKNREKFEAVTCKAVAALPTLLEYAAPFVKVGGKIFAFKGQNYGQEIETAGKALSALHCEIERVEQKELDPETTRYLVVIKKTAKTPNIYPREKNLPRTHPLM